jgi:hypothetical protein
MQRIGPDVHSGCNHHAMVHALHGPSIDLAADQRNDDKECGHAGPPQPIPSLIIKAPDGAKI